MKAILCDQCGATIGENEVGYGDYITVDERAKLTITLAKGLELCPACIRKAYYAIARDAFYEFRTPRRKAPTAPMAEGE